MKITSLVAFARVSAIALFIGLGASTAYGQANGGGISTGTGIGSSGGTGSSSSSSLFSPTNSGSSSLSGSSGSTGSTGSTGSLGSSSSMGSSGSSNTGSSGSSGSTGNAGTTIQTGTIGGGNIALQRGEVLNRNGVGSNLITSNYDVIGGQSASNNNQAASLFSQIGRQIGQGGNFNQQGGRNAARPSIRIPLKLGFVAKPTSVPQFTAKFESRIVKLNGISAISPIRISMDGSTAVLTGVVATEQDRLLAEGVAMLEPEVESVRNAITVQEPESNSDSLSPPKTP